MESTNDKVIEVIADTAVVLKKPVLKTPNISQETEEDKKENQAQELMVIAKTADLFKDQMGEPFAAFKFNNHIEVWRVDSREFKEWLIVTYLKRTGRIIGSDALNRVILAVRSSAKYGGKNRSLSLRATKYQNSFMYDLADEAWRAVQITPDGWKVLNRPPVVFKRSLNQAAQVEPAKSGADLRDLLKFVNLKSEDDQILFLPYVVSCFVPDINHSIINFTGSKGSAKSTAAKVLRSLVDPAKQYFFVMPGNQEQLVHNLHHNYLTIFDNVEKITPAQSNILCQASTGGASGKRKIHTDTEEVILPFNHLVALTSINPVAERPDLLDRTFTKELKQISPDQRRSEQEFWNKFDEAKPHILGSIFDVLSKAMAIHPSLHFSEMPRMADSFGWGCAIAEAIGIGRDRYQEAYYRNIDLSNEAVISNNSVASATVAFMEKRTRWTGKMSEFYSELRIIAKAENIPMDRKSNWPNGANKIRNVLTTVCTNLSDVGISYTIEGKTSGSNKGCVEITLVKTGGLEEMLDESRPTEDINELDIHRIDSSVIGVVKCGEDGRDTDQLIIIPQAETRSGDLTLEDMPEDGGLTGDTIEPDVYSTESQIIAFAEDGEDGRDIDNIIMPSMEIEVEEILTEGI